MVELVFCIVISFIQPLQLSSEPPLRETLDFCVAETNGVLISDCVIYPPAALLPVNRIVHEDGMLASGFGKYDAGVGEALKIERCGV